MTIRRPIRRRLMGTTSVTLRPPVRARSFGSGGTRILIGFAFILATGTGLLMLPAATEADGGASLLEAMFTAVSAICVTGHVIVETETHWSTFGEIVILALIQIGGLGYMLGASLFFWAMGRRLGLRDRNMLRLYYGAPSMGETMSFARTVAYYAIVAELAGMLLLWFFFMFEGLPAGRAAWWAVFHAISAFNNAGFNVTGNDLIDFHGSTPVLLAIAALVIAGGLGGMPVITLLRRREWLHLPVDHKVIFAATGVLLLFGTLTFLIAEWNNEATLGAVSPTHRPVLAFFQATVPRTAGFSAVDTSAFYEQTEVLQTGLMFIGGAAGSTAGGIKLGTFVILLVAVVATIRGRNEVVIFGREIEQGIVRQAMVITMLGGLATFLFTFVLSSISNADLLDILFDVVSAVGTVGLSSGYTASAGPWEHVLLMIAMLLGRFGPLLLVLEMSRPRPKSNRRYAKDSIRLG